MSLFDRATQWNVCCGVCARHAEGIGLATGPYDSPKSRILCWICDDPECAVAAKALTKMPRFEIDNYEKQALREGGDKAGAYLDEIGETDLAKLQVDQWEEFCRRMLAGYGEAMKRQLLTHQPPF